MKGDGIIILGPEMVRGLAGNVWAVVKDDGKRDKHEGNRKDMELDEEL